MLSDWRRLTELLTGIHAPTMLVIGSDDRIASIADGEQSFISCLVNIKRCWCYQRKEGHFDYGHVDPALGHRAEYEAWLIY